ncbi:MAG: hypothetical protein QNJ32_10975 [Xenococcaceae cyanobacterium MO_167.B27]|nr:hypothetical protein [Xenococcaceae cyanobacterium MO_167.B27]
MSKPGTLIFCGKMGSGKSTTAIKLANEYDAILFSEDESLETIYPEEIKLLDMMFYRVALWCKYVQR